MSVLAANIVALKHTLSICRHRSLFSQADGATIYAFIFDSSCRRRQNMPSTLKQIVAENSNDLEIKY